MTVFIYLLLEKSGSITIISKSLSAISMDKCIQALLIAFAFVALLEETTGFGVPVTITAAMLVGFGFEPFRAVFVCLVANTVSVLFGGMGIPIIVSAQITNIDPILLGEMVGKILFVMNMIIPFYMVFLLSGWRKILGIIPAIVTCGLSFAITQYLVSNLVGPALPAIIAAIVTIIALMVLMKFWQPREYAIFPPEDIGTKN